MDDKLIYLFLSTLKSKDNIKKIIRSGYKLSDISTIVEHCLATGKIIFDRNGRFELTEEGMRYLLSVKAKFKELSKTFFILPANESKIEKIKVDFIYLPSRKELIKLKEI